MEIKNMFYYKAKYVESQKENLELKNKIEELNNMILALDNKCKCYEFHEQSYNNMYKEIDNLKLQLKGQSRKLNYNYKQINELKEENGKLIVQLQELLYKEVE